MSARDLVLSCIRSAEADVETPAPLAPAQAAPADPVAQFVAQADKVRATTSRISSLDDLPVALAEELRNRDLPAPPPGGSFQNQWAQRGRG